MANMTSILCLVLVGGLCYFAVQAIHDDAAKRESPSHPSEEEELFETLMTHYNYKQRPNLGKGKADVIKIGAYINGIHSVQSYDMTMEMFAYLRYKWNDPRLAFPDKYKSAIDKYFVHPDDMDKIWKPDIFVRNLVSAELQKTPNDNRLMTISPTGDIWFVMSISMTLSCPMKLQKFPMDTQSCPILFESYSHTQDALDIHWLDHPWQLDPAIQLPEFTLLDFILYDCSQNFTTGAYPCQEVKFIMSRDSGYYILQIYVPSALGVALSWVAFWLSAKASMERISMGITLVLTLVALGIGVKTMVPKVSYLMAIDVWTVTCILFVVASVLEYAVVHVVSDADGSDEEKQKLLDDTVSKKSSRIDLVSRVVFPLAFLIFVIVYSIVYTLPIGPSA